jgi:hypothetical protein
MVGIRVLPILPWLLTCHGFAERRPLDPPPLVEFRLEDHISERYAAAIEALEGTAGCFDDASLSGTIAVFRETLDQPRLLEAGEALASGLYSYGLDADCLQSEPEARKALRVKVEEIQALIDRGRYLAHPLGVPVQFEVDEERRLYRVSWRQWEGDVWSGGWKGPEILKVIPFVPQVRVVVEATYTDGRFGYRVTNLPESEAALSRKTIELEAFGLTRELARLNQSVPLEDRRFPAEEGRFGFSLPARVQGTYRFSHYDGSKPWSTEPGETYMLPPLLKVPWKNTPGILHCWLRVSGWDPSTLGTGIDPEIDPPNVMNLFSEYAAYWESGLGPTRGPRFAYHGKTIGPVPVPQPGERAEFVERIRSYFQEARDWGWVPDQAWAEEMAMELANLDQSDPDPSEVLRLVDEVEAAYASERLLHEAHALLKYNLEHLADPANWAPQP